MSRLFKDGAGITYDGVNGKFVSVPFGKVISGTTQIDNPTGIAMEPFSFGADTGAGQDAFLLQADNSMAGLQRDCGECHVGGGGMQFIPRNGGATFDAKGELVQADRVVYGSAEYDALVAGKVTSFNYFIDVFDEDGDGDTTDVVVADYNKSGVMEMDCLMCHLNGYSWQASKDAKRLGQFGASRVVGAGIGTAKYDADDRATLYAGAGDWGTAVTYDTNVVQFGEDCIGSYKDYSYCSEGSLAWTIDLTAAGSLEAVPPTENCAACHQSNHQVDWKKRGEEDPSLDVHAALGCMGCHERKNAVIMDGHNPDVAVYNGMAKAKVLGHDPAKGSVGPWDNLQNKVDDVDFKKCSDCHAVDGDLGDRGQSFGAPNPASAHAAAGLSAMILQTGKSGKADANHLDIIGCQACHVTKAGGETGGAFVDGTGPDHEGRLADHDSAFVGRTMEGNFGYNWTNDKKIHPGNFLTSFFLRDKNDHEYDINNDGRAGGMDALLQTHIAKAIAQGGNGLYAHGVFQDGVVSATEVQDMLDLYNNVDPTVAGNMFSTINGNAPPATGSKVLFSFLTVPFTMSHSIDPSEQALGANGCTDCHAAAADGPTNGGIFNRVVEMSGDSDISWNAGQMTPMTKVNGMSQVTFSHPKLRDKWLVRSLPLVLHKGSPDTPANGANGIKDVGAGESLYEATFMALADFTDQAIVGTDITTEAWPTGAATTHGFWMKIETCVDANADVVCDGEVTARTAVAKGQSTDIDDLLVKLNMGAANYNTAHEFIITVADGNDDLANDHFVITPKDGFLIRVHPYSNAAGIQIAGKPTFGYGVLSGAYKADPITPTCQDPALNGGFDVEADATDILYGRADMLTYLNALGQDANSDGVTNGEECFALGSTPDAGIISVEGVTNTGGTAPIEVAAGNTVTLAAAGDANATFKVYDIEDYGVDKDTGVPFGTELDVVDGDVQFTAPGTYRIVATTTTADGKTDQSWQYVYVAPVAEGAAEMSFLVTGTGDVDDVAVDGDPTDPYVAQLTISPIPTPAADKDPVAFVRIQWEAGESYITYPVGTGVYTYEYGATVPAGNTVMVNFYDAANNPVYDHYEDTIP